MGRTRRKRARRKQFPPTLDHHPTLINLRKYMTHNNWNNDNRLQLREFQETGRGLRSLRPTRKGDVLIRVPFKLMVTYATLKPIELFRNLRTKLTIQELLTVFLALEKNKHGSKWESYIRSLPFPAPTLPWMLPKSDIDALPNGLKVGAHEARTLFEGSWRRCRKSITGADCVLEASLFSWAYVLVNTRAVYVDPQLVRELCDTNDDCVSDEPCMGLCPYLDMFNHSHAASTKAELIRDDKGQLSYQLTTLTSYRKYDQIFISYGPHNNQKLLLEYGFFIPGNANDTINFHWQEVLCNLTLELNEYQYKFIRQHNLDDYSGMFINTTGPSFALKAFVFVALNRNLKNFCDFVYSASYSNDFLQELNDITRILLQSKLKLCEEECKIFKKRHTCKNEFVFNYLNYCKITVEELLYTNYL